MNDKYTKFERAVQLKNVLLSAYDADVRKMHGKMLTLIDAIIADPEQRKAAKNTLGTTLFQHRVGTFEVDTGDIILQFISAWEHATGDDDFSPEQVDEILGKDFKLIGRGLEDIVYFPLKEEVKK